MPLLLIATSYISARSASTIACRFVCIRLLQSHCVLLLISGLIGEGGGYVSEHLLHSDILLGRDLVILKTALLGTILLNFLLSNLVTVQIYFVSYERDYYVGGSLLVQL